MIEYWHNPRCSKSREGLALLESKGAELRVRRYLEDAPSRTELVAVWEAMGKPAVATMMRRKDAAFREAGLAGQPDAALFDALRAHVGGNVEVVEMDLDINADAFAERAAALLMARLKA